MEATIYILCALTCLLCTVLLLRRWKTTGLGLLFWSGICFLTLTVANVLLFVDRIIVPASDLATLRNSITLLAILFMLVGLIMGRRNV
jgi:hypothetical protein